GDQLECINCALCVDACNDVMKRVGLPRGLIGYDSLGHMEQKAQGVTARYRFLRPRVVVYAVALVAVAAVMLFALNTRATIDLNVLRDRNPTFVRLSDGSVRNAYTVKVMNRANAQRDFTLSIDGPKGFDVKIVGVEQVRLPISFAVDSDRLRTLRVLVTVPAASLKAESMPITFAVADGAETKSTETVFLSDGDER
ncbi:MAG: cytochrome c oxidase accessory protein CcoG, partial [Alphaproteobacteria bacterium]|nr:cytochrome c oxidase accessory protein CcoG [Alphaproteobacteria bacterium]